MNINSNKHLVINKLYTTFVSNLKTKVMSHDPENPQAFPYKSVERGNLVDGPQHHGMTIKDVCVVAVINGMLSNSKLKPDSIENMVSRAYTIAEEVLKQR
jgi:hypothetical protein